MMSLYSPGETALHRLPAGTKLLGLVLAGTSLFFVADIVVLSGALILVCGAYLVANMTVKTLFAQLRPILWIVLILFVAQAFINGWQAGLVVVLRLMNLILLAALITLTTRVSEMTDTLEWAIQPLGWVGVDPRKISLVISMAIRFIPLISQITAEVREAQRARGIEKSIVALAIPVVIRTLKMADDIADAMEARGFDADPR
ncbi:energy-coupling factor transporter transmembrane protein EcfT [Aestuariivita sp.]|jgi:biotin transport system permease protein|uniref:energy-coupling factor transporter transmembrane component T family protein n=1 Tax=Aestuariivita sp. TaxID=1872407 RepID=UPI00216C110E|nr:energy-coupling factor transporter transmembrane protein EcfT [Aestuariivita sp.]MCE8009305.1 energy-coupling factor transporter transmembrane protein EcfT [Aestuariivita sp.]